MIYIIFLQKYRSENLQIQMSEYLRNEKILNSLACRLKMASLLAAQTLFSAPQKFFVDPPTMDYGKSRNAKKTDFFISKIVNISELVIDRGNPNAPLERFIQAHRFEPKFSSLSGHQAAQMSKYCKSCLALHRVAADAP